MPNYLEFERPLAELESKIEDLRQLADDDGAGRKVPIAKQINDLQGMAHRLLRQTYERLTPWQKVQVARHPDRPHFSAYAGRLIDDFTPLAGDRSFAEDPAIVGGLGRFRGYSVVVLGLEKGADTESRLRHNFGMARPEGYRKARRLMQCAEQFRLPVLTFVDTSGAYPGVGAEERGQAEAIARCIHTSLSLHVPVIAVVIGEGGSGGAIALATANRVFMLEHAIYSVISPEGCASILWRDAQYAEKAAAALQLTAQDLMARGIIDGVIREPVGGAHRNPDDMVDRVGDQLESALRDLVQLDGGILQARREDKFLEMGRGGLV